MMQKPRPLGRSRTTPREARRARGVTAQPATALAAALGAARRFVTARWPELASVKPNVTPCVHQPPRSELLARLGLDGVELQQAGRQGAYMFTFVGERRLPDGQATPMVANVMVNARLEIVKTSISR